MRLPDNSIGISDIKNRLDCGRRFAFGMRRWTEGAEPPEDVHPDTMYGTIFHDAVEAIERDDLSDDEALTLSFSNYAGFLGPDDMEKLKGDLQTYRERDEALGVRCVANEKEIRVPLLRWTYPGDDEPTTIYFRAKIDRLYQRLDNPTVFLHRDYKSSKWPKSEAEVHKDEQMWAYNFGIHENWPECEHLNQIYDQLRYGEIPTRKSEEQREQMREWLILQVTAILEAEEMEPTLNEWCPWCPIKADCPVIDRLTDFYAATITALLPEDESPDPAQLEVYVEKLPEVQTAVKTLKAYEDQIKGVLRRLPADRREALGWKLTGGSVSSFSADALETVHEVLGDDFYRLAKISQRGVTDFLKGDDRLDLVVNLAHKDSKTPSLRRTSRG